MAEQPMGLGVGPSRFGPKSPEAAVKEAEALERLALQEAARLEAQLQTDPLLPQLIAEMEETMLKLYMESAEGKIQMKLMNRLGRSIDPSIVSKNLVRKLAMIRLGRLSETQAAP